MTSAQRLIIAEKLRERLRIARAEYEGASIYFREVVGDIPGCEPSPDGALIVQHAGRAARDALRTYMAALETLHALRIHGIVPDEFKSR